MSSPFYNISVSKEDGDAIANILKVTGTGVPEVECRIKYTNPVWIQSTIWRLSSLVSPESIEDVSESKADLRKISTSKDIIFQRKQKAAHVDLQILQKLQPETYIKVRFAKAFELPVSKKDWETTPGAVTTRIRSRLSWIFDKIRIDITNVTYKESGKNENEVEVEFLEAVDTRSVITGFATACKILFPEIHTLIFNRKTIGDLPSDKQAADVVQRDSAIRPVNIQLDKHFDEKIHHYAATNKLDGVGYYLWADSKKNRLWLFNRTDFWEIYHKAKFDESWLCKAEVVIKKNSAGVLQKCEIWLFDAIWSSANKVRLDDSLLVRTAFCKEVQDVLQDVAPFNSGSWRIQAKTFFSSGRLSENIFDAVRWMADNYGALDCNSTNDGLVFEPLAGGASLPTLKWKFPSTVSIDFYMRKISAGSQSRYMLFTRKKDIFVPIQRNYKDWEIQRTGLFSTTVRIEKYPQWRVVADISPDSSISTLWEVKDRGVNIIQAKLRPVANKPNFFTPFILDFDPFIIDGSPAVVSLPSEKVCDGITCGDLDGLIGEFVMRDGSLHLHRIRYDKTEPNGARVARETYRDMVQPLLLPQVLEKLQTPSVIKTGCLDEYRKWHNEIKRRLILENCDRNVVLDLGIGKGGDLKKYIDAKVSELWGIDPSQENLQELSNRLSDAFKYFAKKVHILAATGAQDTNKIINWLRTNNAEKDIEVVAMMFSLTYLFKDNFTLSSVANTISSVLNEEGVFFGTVLDGWSLREKMRADGTTNLVGDCWEIRSEEIPDGRVGQPVSVNLEGTQTARDLYEYAAFLNLLSEKLLAADIVMKSYNRFEEFGSISTNMDLNNLYSAFVYQKGIRLDDQWCRVYTEADGSCWFHAVLFALLGPYYKESVAHEFRKIVSEHFSYDDFMSLQGGLVALVWLNEHGFDLAEVQQDQYVLAETYAGYLETKRNLRDCSYYAESTFQPFIEELLGVNVLTWLAESKKFVSNKVFNEFLPTVAVYLEGQHYETMVWKGNENVNYILPNDLAKSLAAEI